MLQFGDVVNGKMILNPYRKIAQKYWLKIPKHYENIIMLNNIHEIINIEVGTEQCSVPTLTFVQSN